MTLYKNITKKEKTIQFLIQRAEVHGVKKCNMDRIIHVIDLSDLICVKEEINIVKSKS